MDPNEMREAAITPSPAAPPPPGRIDTVLAPIDDEVDPWHASDEPPFVFTYEFETAPPADLWDAFTGWVAFTVAQKTAVRAILAEFQSIVDVTFTEVTGAADPDINFGRVNLPSAGQGGFQYAWSSDGSGRVVEKEIDGYAVFQQAERLIDANGRNLILHEIGHALMLKHPGNYDLAGQHPSAAFFPADEDNNKFSVMSYNNNPDNNAVSDHLMLYDIAALQARWGANLSTRTGNDIYAGPNGRIQAVWDAGGTDTINGSAFSAVKIDLREGAFSSLGATDNLAIAFGTVIENATGGPGADTLTGNDVANTLNGGPGADLMSGGAGDDSYRVDNVLDRASESAGQGTDAVVTTRTYTLPAIAAIEFLRTSNLAGTTAINLIGNEAANTLEGNAAANLLNARAGADTMRGFAGNDSYVIDNVGDRILEAAGQGNDSARASVSYSLAAGADVESLQALDLAGTSALNLFGNRIVNFLTGNAGTNLLNGGAGADLLRGLGGNDSTLSTMPAIVSWNPLAVVSTVREPASRMCCGAGSRSKRCRPRMQLPPLLSACSGTKSRIP